MSRYGAQCRDARPRKILEADRLGQKGNHGAPAADIRNSVDVGSGCRSSDTLLEYRGVLYVFHDRWWNLLDRWHAHLPLFPGQRTIYGDSRGRVHRVPCHLGTRMVQPVPEVPDLLRRIDALLAAGGDVLLFRESELYQMKTLVGRYTQAPVRFVVGISLMIQAFEGIYGNLEGRLLEALARLLAQNVRIYAYPMSSVELRERLKGFPARGWEWDDTDGMVSAGQVRHAPPLGHLYAYLLASNFLVPMQVPATLKADA